MYSRSSYLRKIEDAITRCSVADLNRLVEIRRALIDAQDEAQIEAAVLRYKGWCLNNSGAV